MAAKAPKTKKSSKECEFEKVTRWRFDELRRIGLAPDEAMSLIEMPDVAHAAQALADKGCPPGLIASLLGKD